MKAKPTSKTIRVPSIRSMTPEKYKALSPELKRAYNKKAKAKMDAFDAMIDKRNLESYRRFAEGFSKLLADARFLEGEIIRDYLRRENKYLVDRNFFAENPRFAHAHAEFEYSKFVAEQEAKRQAKKKTTKLAKKGNKSLEKNIDRMLKGVLDKTKK